jgi:hypothetical protein
VLSRRELLGQSVCNTDNNPADESGYGLKYAETTKITRQHTASRFDISNNKLYVLELFSSLHIKISHNNLVVYQPDACGIAGCFARMASRIANNTSGIKHSNKRTGCNAHGT